MPNPLNMPPYVAKSGGREWILWFNQLMVRVTNPSQIKWSQLIFTDSKLTDLATRNHSDLQSIGVADDTSSNATKDKHVSNAMMKAIPDHTSATSAHGAGGDVVGNTDWATDLVGGVVKLAAAIADANASAVSVTSADASDLATVITLANEMKGDINQLVTDVNLIKDQLNALMASERTAKQLTP